MLFDPSFLGVQVGPLGEAALINPGALNCPLFYALVALPLGRNSVAGPLGSSERSNCCGPVVDRCAKRDKMT